MTLSLYALFLSLLASPLTVPGVSPIVAEVNGQVITRRDVDVTVGPVLPQLESRFEGEELVEKKKEFYARALENLVEHRLLVQEAKDLGIVVNEKIVDAHLEKDIPGRQDQAGEGG